MDLQLAMPTGQEHLRQAANVTIQELGSIGELVGAIATVAAIVSPAIRNALLEYLAAHPDHPTLLDLMRVMTRHE